MRECEKHFITKGMGVTLIISLIIPFACNIVDIRNGLFPQYYVLYDRSSFFAITMGFIVLFIPTICGMISATTLCTELNSGYSRYILLRKSKVRYIVDELIWGALAGGVGTAMPGVVLWLFSLPCQPISPEEIAMGEHSALGYVFLGPYETALGGNAPILVYILTMFIFGIVWSVLALACAAFFKNMFIAMAMPFIVCFSMHIIMNQSGYDGLSPLNMVGAECLAVPSLKHILIYQGVLFAIFVSLYVVAMKRSLTNG